ncbi:MAG: hypothetical protein HYZ24_10245 [Chloroflexi bacterium]|nr:hypothetical protein [Chloroflexota bacterium]
MLTPTDILRLPCTPDLTEGGIAYALRSLPFGEVTHNQIRRMVAQAAVELAFRRYLAQHDIPFEVSSANPFSEPGKHDVILGGHRCDIKSFFISRRSQILDMRNDPSILLDAPALVPSDHHAGDGHSENDLYVFAFLAGLTAASQDDLRKALAANQPHHLIHVMPEEWRNPFDWNPLAPLVLKSDSEETMLVEVSGQDEGRGVIARTVVLPPKTRAPVDDPFCSITSIHAKTIPTARLGIHSPAIRETHVIAPLEWGNIWVYGMETFLTGFISRGEFRRRAKPIPSNSRVFQYDHTKTKNLAVDVSSLHPMRELFARVRGWEAQKKG